MCSSCSGTPPTAITRQEFLKLSGAGIAGAALLGVMGSGSALAQSNDQISTDVNSASTEYNVPAELLLAIGYVNTRWETPPVEAGAYEPDDIHGSGGYGPMHLSENPQKNTLARASELTGIPQEDLKTDRAANTNGAAAVLDSLAGEQNPSDLAGWYEAVKQYGDGDLFAQEVYRVLEEGARTETPSGQTVEIEPRPGIETPRLFTAQAAGDYPGSTWYGAANGNYGSGRTYDGTTYSIRKIVIHVMQGSWSSAINWFKDSRAGVSAHYNVRSSDGFIGQSVRERDTGYHAGDLVTNLSSIGIEHEGYVSDSRWFTDAMYRSSAKLTAYLCKKYNIPIDRNHIIGHYEVPGCSGAGGGRSCHTDPGYLSGGQIRIHWNWTRYMDLVRYYAGASSPTASKPSYLQVVDNRTAGRFRASSRWVSSDYHSSTDLGSDYRVLRKPSRTARNAAFKVRIPSNGRYTIQARWPGDSGYNPKTTFMVRTANGWVRRRVDQRSGGRWVTLGTYQMAAGDNWWVAVSCKSRAKGYIIADAVRVVGR